jgi:two-component system chemotaxis response regulator CheB
VERIQVLVCDDSETDLQLLVRMLLRNPDIDVAAVARRGDEVMPLVERVQPSLITLDLTLPGKDGLEVIEEVMSKRPTPILVISGRAHDPEVALEALARGAVEVIEKPELSQADTSSLEQEAARLGELVRVLSRVKVIRHVKAKLVRKTEGAPAPGSAAASTETKPFVGTRSGAASRVGAVESPSKPAGARRNQGPQVVANPVPADKTKAIGLDRYVPKTIVGIAASTGGPQALREVLGGLTPGLGAPVLVVQHIARGFTESFVQWLSGATGLRVDLGRDGMPLHPGVVYVAPEDAHMVVQSGRLKLVQAQPQDKHVPSADVLFRSIAEEAEGSSICVVLTGMGNDGASGAAAVEAAGGKVIVQDEETSAVFGMPKAVLDSGIAARVLPLSEIPAAVETSVRENAGEQDMTRRSSFDAESAELGS